MMVRFAMAWGRYPVSSRLDALYDAAVAFAHEEVPLREYWDMPSDERTMTASAINRRNEKIRADQERAARGG